MEHEMKQPRSIRHSGLLVGAGLALMLVVVGCAGPQVTATEPEPPAREGKPMPGAMMHDQSMMKAMPLRLVVMEATDGKAMLSYYRPSTIFAKYQGMDNMARELDGVLEAVVAAISR